MINAGRLDKRITLMAPQGVQNDAGETVNTPRAVWGVWANITQAAATEGDTNNQTQARITWTVTIRWRDDITEAWTVALGDGRTLAISSIVERGRREEQIITAHEVR